MKKTLLILLAFVAISSQAATVLWPWKSSAGIKFGSTNLGGNGTAYLLFIGNESISKYSFSEYVAMTEDPVAQTPTKTSKINVAAVETADTPGNFVSVVSFVDDGKTYWNVSSTIYELTQANIDALVENGVALPSSSFEFSSTVKTGAGTVGGGWAQVPEPSTAALALAGLALLLKRRKA